MTIPECEIAILNCERDIIEEQRKIKQYQSELVDIAVLQSDWEREKGAEEKKLDDSIGKKMARILELKDYARWHGLTEDEEEELEKLESQVEAEKKQRDLVKERKIKDSIADCRGKIKFCEKEREKILAEKAARGETWVGRPPLDKEINEAKAKLSILKGELTSLVGAEEAQKEFWWEEQGQQQEETSKQLSEIREKISKLIQKETTTEKFIKEYIARAEKSIQFYESRIKDIQNGTAKIQSRLSPEEEIEACRAQIARARQEKADWQGLLDKITTGTNSKVEELKSIEQRQKEQKSIEEMFDAFGNAMQAAFKNIGESLYAVQMQKIKMQADKVMGIFNSAQ